MKAVMKKLSAKNFGAKTQAAKRCKIASSATAPATSAGASPSAVSATAAEASKSGAEIKKKDEEERAQSVADAELSKLLAGVSPDYPQLEPKADSEDALAKVKAALPGGGSAASAGNSETRAKAVAFMLKDKFMSAKAQADKKG